MTRSPSPAVTSPRSRRAWAGALGLVVLLAGDARAYSVFAHQDAVDALWDSDLAPLLRRRFAGIADPDVAAARAYAYGGALIQDLGYYPFGSHLFTNLTHYVRTGDFVEALIRGAADVNEYAFALGALAHYASDNAGHPLAVNPGVPMMYPKVRAKVGDRALYVDSPSRHIMVEFAHDVLRVARGGYVAQAFRDRIGFEVSKAALERAVRDTYALDLGDMLLSVDLAIGTYRKAVSSTIPELTRIAWRDHHEEIEARTPGITEESFVFTLSAQEYDREFGTKYRKPGLFSRFVALLLKIVPKIGPFKPLAFEPLSPEVERLFRDSAESAVERYRAALLAIQRPDFELANTDFDTGTAPQAGRNRLADETYADLLHKLAKDDFEGVPDGLKRHLQAYFDGENTQPRAHRPVALNPRVRRELASLAASR